MAPTDDIDRTVYVCQRMGITTSDIVEYIDIEHATAEKGRSEAFTTLTDSFKRLGIYGNCLAVMDFHLRDCQNCWDVYEKQLFAIEIFKAAYEDPHEEGLERILNIVRNRKK